jgi:hypothetical protein
MDGLDGCGDQRCCPGRSLIEPISLKRKNGAPRASPWSPTNIPTYAPGRCSASARKRQGFGGSSAGWRNPPKHSRSIAVTVAAKVTHSSTTKAVPARRSTSIKRHKQAGVTARRRGLLRRRMKVVRSNSTSPKSLRLPKQRMLSLEGNTRQLRPSRWS